MSVQTPFRPVHRPRRVDPPRRRQWMLLASVATVLVVALFAAAFVVLSRHGADSRRNYLGADGRPAHGEAAYAVDGRLHARGEQRPVPIASLAKVMTAYLVLREHPLRMGQAGFTMRVTRGDVADTARRKARSESIVPVAAGERLTERQALEAVLLPSANNVAELLARHTAGSAPAFVARMNAEARALHMTRTHYSDPSGYASSTVSTAYDQTLLARAVAGDSTLSAIAALGTASLPVAGTVRNTDTLLAGGEFVGTKTGSDDAAGGCFMFRTYRVVDGRLAQVVGVVLGQQGRYPLTAGLYAARQWMAHVAPHLPG